MFVKIFIHAYYKVLSILPKSFPLIHRPICLLRPRDRQRLDYLQNLCNRDLRENKQSGFSRVFFGSVEWRHIPVSTVKYCLKSRKWSSWVWDTVILVWEDCSDGATPLPSTRIYFLASLNRYLVRFGIHFWSALCETLSAIIDNICRPVCQLLAFL